MSRLLIVMMMALLIGAIIVDATSPGLNKKLKVKKNNRNTRENRSSCSSESKTTTPCPRPQCGLNEVYSARGNDGCQPTCMQPTVSPTCVGVCSTPACICAVGFVRHMDGSCVLPQNCFSCGPNEVHSACGDDGCQPTCTQPRVSSRCVPVCSTPACICAVGFVRNSVGSCVLPQNCSLCGANEVYSACGNDGCQPTCTTPEIAGCIPICSTPSCICAPGFVRNTLSGDCVDPNSCPIPECALNEVYSVCGDDGCQPTCTQPTVSPTCQSVCSTPACICAVGFVRNSVGSCVLPQNCFSCGPNERFSTCGDDGCQPTCTNQEITDCIPKCTEPNCICVPGFFRDTLLSGKCVSRPSCPDSAQP